jgi:hypothetical protein
VAGFTRSSYAFYLTCTPLTWVHTLTRSKLRWPANFAKAAAEQCWCFSKQIVYLGGIANDAKTSVSTLHLRSDYRRSSLATTICAGNGASRRNYYWFRLCRALKCCVT